MPWAELITGIFGLLTALVGGSLFVQWWQQRERRRRWRKFADSLPPRLREVLNQSLPYTPEYLRGFLTQLLTDADYAPEEMTEAVLHTAQSLLINVLYDTAKSHRTHEQAEVETRVLALLQCSGVAVEEQPPHMAAPETTREGVSLSAYQRSSE